MGFFYLGQRKACSPTPTHQTPAILLPNLLWSRHSAGTSHQGRGSGSSALLRVCKRFSNSSRLPVVLIVWLCIFPAWFRTLASSCLAPSASFFSFLLRVDFFIGEVYGLWEGCGLAPQTHRTSAIQSAKLAPVVAPGPLREPDGAHKGRVVLHDGVIQMEPCPCVAPLQTK